MKGTPTRDTSIRMLTTNQMVQKQNPLIVFPKRRQITVCKTDTDLEIFASGAKYCRSP